MLPQQKDWMRFYTTLEEDSGLKHGTVIQNFLKVRVHGEGFHSFLLRIPMNSDDTLVRIQNFSKEGLPASEN